MCISGVCPFDCTIEEQTFIGPMKGGGEETKRWCAFFGVPIGLYAFTVIEWCVFIVKPDCPI